MRKKLFKIAYRLHLYRLAYKISPREFAKEFIKALGEFAKEYNKAVKEVKAEPEE